jgi:hypothetical protein
MDQGTRTRPATAADFHRLADLAHERGLRVFETGPNQWFCTSHTDPFALHVATGFSCDCRGFLHHQRCSHHAALLAHLGWLPEVEPTAELPQLEATGQSAQLDCPTCCGCGVQTYRTFEERCSACGGSGVKPDHRLTGLPAVLVTNTIAAAA